MADLDGDGRLHIREQQTIVFNGAWNGGERRFNLRRGQQLTLHNIFRIDSASGQEITLQQGDLNRLDHWVWHNATTLRWRARLPSSPPFNAKAITYILDYTLSGILLPVEDGYRLNHDFAFPDRDGEIEQFSLQLRLDPSWQVRGNLETNLQRSNIPPGKSVLLSANLLHPLGVPSAVARKNGRASDKDPPDAHAAPAASAPVWVLALVILLLWSLVILQGMYFLTHERKMGRFKKLLPVDRINASWLEEHVFCLTPEVVGATWDKRTGASEVAAVLARMVLEEKVESRVEQDRFPWLGFLIPGRYTLYLRLLASRSELRGYERELVDGLFIDGDKTDTKKIKKYYRSKRKTFDPISKIGGPIKERVAILTKSSKNPLEMVWVPTLIAMAISFFLLFADFFFNPYEHLQEILINGVLVFIWISSLLAAAGYRAAATQVKGKAWLLWGWTVGIVMVYTGVLFILDLSSLLVLGSAFLCFALVNNVLNVGKTRDSKEGVRLRRHLASARRYLQQELDRESPNLKDSWFPYLVAYGLGPNVDSWFRRYGSHVSHMGSSLSASYGNPGFTGGGGQFGGGGAGGAWSTAAGSLSTSASSSSGGFSGGGGSGGGGGGGF